MFIWHHCSSPFSACSRSALAATLEEARYKMEKVYTTKAIFKRSSFFFRNMLVRTHRLSVRTHGLLFVRKWDFWNFHFYMSNIHFYMSNIHFLPLQRSLFFRTFLSVFVRKCSKSVRTSSKKHFEHLENQFEHHPFEPVRPCMTHNPLDHWQVAQWHHLDRCCVTGGVHQPCWPASTTWTRNAFWQLNRSSRMTQTNLRSWSRPVFDDYLFKGYHVYMALAGN